MKMANIDHCFDNMFTNPKDSQGVSASVGSAASAINARWFKSVFFRNPWQKTVKASFCTSPTSVRAQEVFQSTFFGGGAGMLRALVWRWKGPVTSNWRISMQHRVNCLSLIMVWTSTSCCHKNRNCLRQWVFQWEFDVCGPQVREG